ncbi:hypothetical protein ZYGR_0U03120 [Zygosaccharomyces rouxii]|uniref:L-serine ammonia-lyase n=1 Tax=Zygosaccharomyces rouxii TaxID=4956 RepID=A0A1Q3A420_ZYGRO|nr:hypothetical protein ZYGR_0U03120 [Zygosaccharomyces rouxii]
MYINGPQSTKNLMKFWRSMKRHINFISCDNIAYLAAFLMNQAVFQAMPSIYNKTPLLKQIFNYATSAQVFVKYECLQPSGSFKSRGIGHLISKRAKDIQGDGRKSPHVFSSSGGNAGYAAAVAAQKLNLPCTVVIPTTTKQRMADKIRGCGANVVVQGSHWKEADSHLKNILQNQVNMAILEPIYVHPFDNPTIWEGHASIVDEIISSLKNENTALNRVKGIVCSVGGGGLYNGIIQGLEKYNLANKIPLLAVETKGCHVLNTSLQVGQCVEFNKMNSVATSLCTSQISSRTLDYVQKYGSKSIVLEDKEVLQTCLKYAENFNMITEPACGASLHLGYHPQLIERALGKNLDKDDVIIVIACGGSSNTILDLEESLAKLEEAPHLSIRRNATPSLEHENIIYPKRAQVAS